MSVDWQQLSIVEDNRTTGHCDCCGGETIRVFGDIDAGERYLGMFNVGWTAGKPDHGAEFTFILGPWGEGTSPEDRSIVLLDFVVPENEPVGFSVSDECEVRRSFLRKFATNFLDRNSVLNNQLKKGHA